MKKLIGGLALAAVLLSGCSISDSPSPAASSQAATVSPTSSAPSASKADYGRVALKVQADVDKYVDDWTQNSCSAGSVAQGDPLCFTIAMRAESVANIVSLSLEGAQQPKSPSYIGTPPSEMTKIIGTTVTASEDAVAAAKEWRAANCPTDYACQNKTLLLDMAMTDLKTELDAWKLYLN